MKFNKIITMSLLVAATLGMATSCKEDNDDTTSRLFRPIANASATGNNLLVTWKSISGTTEYILELHQVIATDESGNSTYKLIQEARTGGTSYTFSNLAWDEKYMVKIKGTSATKESEFYQTSDVSINYATILSKAKSIDKAVRVSWDATSSDTIKTILVFKENSEDVVASYKVKAANYATGYYDIFGLQPMTTYIFKTYGSNDVFDNATYKGRISATTTAIIDFNTQYHGNYIDIRDWDANEAKDTLKSATFQAMLTEGMTVILRGEQEYKVNNTVIFDKSVTFVTGPTLGDNARFVCSGGMMLAKGVDANVAKLEFIDIDIYSDKSVEGGSNPVATNEEKGFGGRQVFNENGTKSTLDSIVFRNCLIEGFRAVVRAQSANDAVHHVYFDNCTINGIGDQGIVTTTNKAADFRTVTMKNCTVTNVVMACDLRATAGAVSFNIRNCTFCYAPMETKANANTPLLRFNGNTNEVTINIEKSLFGPSMMTKDCDGETVQCYQAGTNGSIFLNPNDLQPNVLSSFHTTFDWTPIGEGEAAKTYGISAITSLGMSETELWQDPAKGNFTIKATLQENDLGAKKWRN